MRLRELEIRWKFRTHLLQARPQIQTTDAALQVARPLLEQEASEHFLILLLDTKLKLLGVHTVSRGALDCAMVDMRVLFCAALMGGAAGIITAHNHPSGDPTPSKEDLKVFDRINQCGDLLGVAVHDHLIVGEGSTWSEVQGGQV